MSDDDLDGAVDESENPAGRIPVPDAETLPVGTPGDYKATRCSTCQKDVWPRGRGQCPICGRIVKGVNFASKQKVNIARRDAIRDQLITEYGPRTLVLRTQCEHLAAIYEGLDTVRAGTPEHQRLIASAKLISEALDEARKTDQAASTPNIAPGLVAMPDSALHDAQSLYERQLRGEVLSERELGVLAYLHRAARGEVLLPPDPTVPEPGDTDYPASGLNPNDEDHPRSIISSGPDPSSTETENRSSAALVAFCVYCGRPCVGKDHHAYETLHYSDPEEIARREKEATAIMRKQITRPLPDWYR